MNAVRQLLLLTAAALVSLSACSQVQAPSPSCRPTVTGDLEIVPFVSKIYGNERKLSIWLPPGYHDPANAQTTYSVLYMFDGAWLFDRCTAPGTHPEVLFTVQQNANHGAAAWGSRFPAAIKFLYPPVP